MLYLNCSSLALHIGWLQKLSKKVVMMERYYPFFCWGLALLFFHSFLPFQLIGLDNKSLVAIWFTCFICNGSIAFLKYYEVLTTKKKEPELLALRPGLVGEYLLVLAKEKSNKLIFHAKYVHYINGSFKTLETRQLLEWMSYYSWLINMFYYSVFKNMAITCFMAQSYPSNVKFLKMRQKQGKRFRVLKKIFM